MNWLKKIRDLLGKFWSAAFHEHDFILGVENLFSVLGKTQQNRQDSWEASHIAADKGKYDTQMPFPIYLEKAALSTDGDTAGMQSQISSPAWSLDDILWGTNPAACFGEGNPDAGWWIHCQYPTPVAYYITDHVVDYTVTFVKDLDYTLDGNDFIFHVNIGDMDLPTVNLTGPDGVLRTYFRLFGWGIATQTENDMVTGIYSKQLCPQAETVWRMHQMGASVYDVKELLTSISSSVVCREDGTVTDSWSEQDRNYLLISNGMVYGSEKEPNYSIGADVHSGDVLFGTLKIVSGRDMEYQLPDVDDVPGIYVRTDAGVLFAKNQSLPADHTTGDVQSNVLPLFPTNEAYIARCTELQEKTGQPEFAVPNTVNPFSYIMRTVRRYRGLLACFSASDMPVLSAALDCVRKTMCISGILTVYVRADSEPATIILSEGSAYAGSQAVPVMASPRIVDMCVSAEVTL